MTTQLRPHHRSMMTVIIGFIALISVACSADSTTIESVDTGAAVQGDVADTVTQPEPTPVATAAVVESTEPSESAESAPVEQDEPVAEQSAAGAIDRSNEIDGVNPCRYVTDETVASVLGESFTGGVAQYLSFEITCDIFAQGDGISPGSFGISINEVVDDGDFQYRYSSNDEIVNIGGVDSYVDSFYGTFVVPAPMGDYAGFTVSVYGECDGDPDCRAATERLVAEVVANR